MGEADSLKKSGFSRFLALYLQYGDGLLFPQKAGSGKLKSFSTLNQDHD
jgi:hypothetical protein